MATSTPTGSQDPQPERKKITPWQRTKFYLQHAHAIWLVPISIALFYLIGVIMQAIFGAGVGTYDMGFWQPLILAAGAVSFAVNISIMILYFALRGLYEYFFGTKLDGKWVNFSKDDWEEKLSTPWRFCIAFFVFLFFVAAVLTVFLKLI